jgi:hypothetical protein
MKLNLAAGPLALALVAGALTPGCTPPSRSDPAKADQTQSEPAPQAPDAGNPAANGGPLAGGATSADEAAVAPDVAAEAAEDPPKVVGSAVKSPMGGLKVNAIPDEFLWDSGEQQCSIGPRKIVYRFHLVRSPDPNYDWEILYHVKTEYNSGSGWRADNNLYSVYYFFSYAGGAKGNDESSIYLHDQPEAAASMLKGKGATPFATRVMRVSAGGGAHGIETTWPGGGGCKYS